LDNKIQILHTHGYKTDIIGLLATWRTPCRLVSTPHGWSLQASLKLKLYEGIDRAIFPFFDAVVPLSIDIFNGLKALPGLRRKLHMIHNCLDISEIDAVQGITDEIAAWKAEGNFVVGYIGQLIARKGLTTLFEAFRRMNTHQKKMAILGEGDQRQELEELAIKLQINKDVAFFGFRDDRLAFLKGFDVFVLPSRLEGIPRCLMEAMAARIAVVASDIPGCTDLIKQDQTGLLFYPDDVESLTACLAKCMDLDVRKELGRNGRDFIMANYSAAIMAKKYQNLYTQIMADSTTPGN
jgi:glycosyltransferase involved in cell wall biosynthesis